LPDRMTYIVVVLFVVAGLIANKFHEKDAMSYHTFGSVVSVIHLRGCEKIDYAICNILKNNGKKLLIMDFFTTS